MVIQSRHPVQLVCGFGSHLGIINHSGTECLATIGLLFQNTLILPMFIPSSVWDRRDISNGPSFSTH